jgi:hypothetical protein
LLAFCLCVFCLPCVMRWATFAFASFAFCCCCCCCCCCCYWLALYCCWPFRPGCTRPIRPAVACCLLCAPAHCCLLLAVVKSKGAKKKCAPFAFALPFAFCCCWLLAAGCWRLGAGGWLALYCAGAHCLLPSCLAA